MVVIPDEFLHRSAPCCEGEEPSYVKAFVINGPEEALDFAVGLGRIGSKQMMRNPQALTGLLKPCQAVGVKRVALREREGVVGQHGFNRVRQRRRDAFEERRGGDTGLIRGDPDHGFTTEVIDGGKFKVITGISERRQIFEVDMKQFAGTLFFVPPGFRPRGSGQLIDAVRLQQALHGAISEAQLPRDPYRAAALSPQPQDAADYRRRRLRRRPVEPPAPAASSRRGRRPYSGSTSAKALGVQCRIRY
jgi:hypothetical protein